MQSVNYFIQLSRMFIIVLLKIGNVIKIKEEEVKISLKTKRKIFFLPGVGIQAIRAQSYYYIMNKICVKGNVN